MVIAEALGGSEDEFARMMTRKARALGMRNTTYRNANGLPNDEQITTARDQALLGIAIQERFPKYYRYFSLASFVYRGSAMRNHNHLLGKVEGVDGIKTGYTRDSGFNLVTSVKRGARHIVAVVLGGRSAGSRDARMRDLIDSHIAEASTKRRSALVAEASEAGSRADAGEAAACLGREHADALDAAARRRGDRGDCSPGSNAPHHAGQGQDRHGEARRRRKHAARRRDAGAKPEPVQHRRAAPAPLSDRGRWPNRWRPPRRSKPHRRAPRRAATRTRAFSASCRR